MRKKLLIVLAVVAVLGLAGCQKVPDYFEYKVLEDHVEITGLNESKSNIAIPAEIEGLPVTGIGDSAFFRCSSLSSIIVKKGSHAEQWANENGYGDLLVVKPKLWRK